MSCRLLGRAACSALALMLLAATAQAADEINALIWCDHSDPNLLKPFEDATGIKVNVKEFEGTGAGFAILDQSKPGDWDVMVIDSIDVPRGVEKGLFEPLPEDKLPFGDLFPEVMMDGSTKIDGKRYGITEKFGYNTISFNKAKVVVEDMTSLSVLTNPKYKGRLAIYDYYLPVIGLAAMSIGKKTTELTEADLPALKDVLLKMKANAKAVTDVVSSQTTLATGESDVLIGGGEWVTAGIAKENPNLDFVIPKEGAALWSQSLAMFKASAKKEQALKFIQYILSPDGQARLATSACYWGMPSNAKATLTAEQKTILRFAEQGEYLKRAQPYPAPGEALDKKMQDLWTEMLQAK
jgi:spermidine/putrescine transport system substrate-binding protein